MPFENYYTVLGVTRKATAQAIRKAYRRLAFRFHPDRNPGNAAAEEQFKKITAAYDVLGDKEKRVKYDLKLSAFEDALAARRAPTSPGPRTAQGRAAPRPRTSQASARKFKEDLRHMPRFEFENNDLDARDFYRGAAVGAVTAAVAALYLKGDAGIVQASASIIVPWLGLRLGRSLGNALVRPIEGWFPLDREFIPVFEWLERILPFLVALLGMYGLALASERWGVMLPKAALWVAAAASALGTVVGAAVGRAFTSSAARFSSKLFGMGLGALIGGLLGTGLGLGLSVARLAAGFNLAVSDLFFTSAVGGGVGSLAASALGSLRPLSAR